MFLSRLMALGTTKCPRDWQVWDGTRCHHPLLEVLVEPHVMEVMPTLELLDPKGLVANVLVYDNHVESARQLQVGPITTHAHGSQTIDSGYSFWDFPDFTW